MKKAVFSHNRNYRVQAMLQEKAAKLMLQTDGNLTVRDFIKNIICDVALEKTTAKTF